MEKGNKMRQIFICSPTEDQVTFSKFLNFQCDFSVFAKKHHVAYTRYFYFNATLS